MRQAMFVVPFPLRWCMTPFNKHDVAHSFSKAAKNYDRHSFIQKEIGGRLLDKLMLVKTAPHCILDVGAGTGFLTRQLQQKYPNSKVIGLDLAHGMTEFAKSKQPWKLWKNQPVYMSGDAECLPLRSHSVDLIFSNCTLQWCTDIKQVLAEFKRVLKPNGILFFSTLGPQTLHELRQSWQKADNHIHVNDFTDMHDLGDLLIQSDFANPVMDMEMITVNYRDVKQLLNDLKGTGAHNVNLQRPKGCTPKSAFTKMIQSYETFKNPDETYPATFEIIYGHGWQNASLLYRQDKEGVVRIPGDKIPLMSAL
jgi:malonyl-CoA O-methyltransferase